MHKNITIITSALAPVTGVFSPEERAEQTKVGIKSVREKIPGEIILVDVSLFPIPEIKKEIASLVDVFLDASKDENVVNLSRNGTRFQSRSEILLFNRALDFIKKKYNLEEYDRIFKLSGRCNITKEFDIKEYDDSTKDKYVFKKSVTSWISPEMRLYETRLWSMSVSKLEDYLSRFPNFFRALDGTFDLEHTYYKFLDKKDVVEFDNIWVEGKVAPNGRYQKD